MVYPHNEILLSLINKGMLTRAAIWMNLEDHTKCNKATTEGQFCRAPLMCAPRASDSQRQKVERWLSRAEGQGSEELRINEDRVLV